MLPEAGIVLDAGTAAFRIPKHLATRQLDVFLSHAHLDHVAGLTFLLTPLALKKVDAVREHLFSAPLIPVVPEFEYRPLTGTALAIGSTTVRWQVLPSHPGTSMAYRLETTSGGKTKTLAYVTDTVADGSYTDFVRGADVLIHECYFPDSLEEWAVKTGHSTTSKVLEVAAAAGVGRLVLVHVDPEGTGDDPLGIRGVKSGALSVHVACDNDELTI